MPNEDFPLRVDGVTAGWAAERRPEDVIPAARTDAWQLVYVRSGTIEERCHDHESGSLRQHCIQHRCC